MKTFFPILAVTILILATSSSFSSAFAFAGGHRAAMMSGKDANYGSTGKCSAGNCKQKKDKGMAVQKPK
jgi:hypothetical protein